MRPAPRTRQGWFAAPPHTAATDLRPQSRPVDRPRRPLVRRRKARMTIAITAWQFWIWFGFQAVTLVWLISK